MAYREIYDEVNIGEIEQGTIINACLAEEYSNCLVSGIIITPRCDIANGKVHYYHYLPIVRFNDWLLRDYWLIISQILEKQMKGTFLGILQKYQLGKSILDFFTFEQILEKKRSLITKKKDLEKCEGLIEDQKIITKWKDGGPITSEVLCHFKDKYPKLLKNVMAELIAHKRKGFYLLDPWDENDTYSVILLREINKISVNVANHFSKGVFLLKVRDEIKSDLDYSLDDDELLYAFKKLKSPFIEHLIQIFFQNFGKIGVDDHDKVLEEELIKLI